MRLRHLPGAATRVRYLSDDLGRRDGEGNRSTPRHSQDISASVAITAGHEKVREHLFVKVKAKRVLLSTKVNQVLTLHFFMHFQLWVTSSCNESDHLYFLNMHFSKTYYLDLGDYLNLFSLDTMSCTLSSYVVPYKRSLWVSFWYFVYIFVKKIAFQPKGFFFYFSYSFAFFHFISVKFLFLFIHWTFQVLYSLYTPPSPYTRLFVFSHEV